MSTTVDAPSGRRRRYVWLAALLVVALGGLFALNRMGVLGSDAPAGTAGQEGFQAQVSARVVNVLETLPADQHGHAGHAGAAGKSTMVCGARVFGIAPPDADSLDEVAQVYAYHMCAVVEPGREWTMAVKLTGPAVVMLAADPPTVIVAEGGDGFQDRLREIIPAQYQTEARDESLTPEGMSELIRRYNDAADR